MGYARLIKIDQQSLIFAGNTEKRSRYKEHALHKHAWGSGDRRGILLLINYTLLRIRHKRNRSNPLNVTYVLKLNALLA